MKLSWENRGSLEGQLANIKFAIFAKFENGLNLKAYQKDILNLYLTLHV